MPLSTPRQTIDKDCRIWMEKLPESQTSSARSRNSSARRAKICSIAWDVARVMEGQAAGTTPSRSVAERSPGEGRRRKQIGENMDKTNNILGDGFEYERSRLILKGPLET